MSACSACGREEENGVQTHHLGCEVAERPPKSTVPPIPEEEVEPLPLLEDQCGREGCTKPRAAQGKGPRPKFCEDHKTTRSK